MTLDTAPRTVAVPDDLAAAIMAAGVQAKWDQLSYSHQREWVEAVAEAKRPETRARRIAAAVGAAVKSLSPAPTRPDPPRDGVWLIGDIVILPRTP